MSKLHPGKGAVAPVYKSGPVLPEIPGSVYNMRQDEIRVSV